MGVKRVNELDFYNLGHNELAKKLDIAPNKAKAAISDQRIQENEDFFREIKIGRPSSSGTRRWPCNISGRRLPPKALTRYGNATGPASAR